MYALLSVLRMPGLCRTSGAITHLVVRMVGTAPPLSRFLVFDAQGKGILADKIKEEFHMAATAMAPTVAERSRPMTREEKKVILASSAGTIFEWYDF